MEQDTVPAVPETATQGTDGRREWWWTEASIWTERMVSALVNGVKGGKWFSLVDKVIRPTTLDAAWRKVARNKGAAGVDGQSIERFASQEERYLHELHDQLKTGTYRPNPVKRVEIPKGDGRTRPLGIPTVKDRIVQTALKMAIEPIFETQFRPGSYGFRPGRSCKDALREVDRLLKATPTWWMPISRVLGYRFEAGRRLVRKKSLMALKDKVRSQTSRSRGDSLGRIIDDLNPILRGWFGYFQHAAPGVFRAIDGFVRRLLRAIRRKQETRPGFGRCKADHQRWPNAFFAEHRLFTLQTAHAQARHSR